MRVLVVDDEWMTRAALRRLLEDEGHEVVEAFTGEAALREVEREPPPEVVLLDISLGPGLNGYDVAARLPRSIDVIIVTGKSADVVRREAMEMRNRIEGALVIMEKPIDDKNLLGIIEAVGLRRKDRPPEPG